MVVMVGILHGYHFYYSQNDRHLRDSERLFCWGSRSYKIEKGYLVGEVWHIRDRKNLVCG